MTCDDLRVVEERQKSGQRISEVSFSGGDQRISEVAVVFVAAASSIAEAAFVVCGQKTADDYQ